MQRFLNIGRRKGKDDAGKKGKDTGRIRPVSEGGEPGNQDVRQVSSLALNNFLRTMGAAAGVVVQDRDQGKEAAANATPEHRQIVMARLVRAHKYFVLKVTNRIYNFDGLVDDGKFDPEVRAEFLNIIDELDQDDFHRDEKDMLKDISARLMDKDPDFVNELVKTLLQEIFRHVNKSPQEWVQIGRGTLTFEMTFLFMGAFREFQTKGGIHFVAKLIVDEYPWVNDLAREYGWRYPKIVQNLVRRGTIRVPSDEEGSTTIGESSGISSLSVTSATSNASSRRQSEPPVRVGRKKKSDPRRKSEPAAHPSRVSTALSPVSTVTSVKSTATSVSTQTEPLPDAPIPIAYFSADAKAMETAPTDGTKSEEKPTEDGKASADKSETKPTDEKSEPGKEIKVDAGPSALSVKSSKISQTVSTEPKSSATAIKLSASKTKTSATSIAKTSATSLAKPSATSIAKTSATSLAKTSATSIPKGSASSIAKTSATSISKGSATSVTKTSATSTAKTSATSLAKTSATSIATKTSATSVAKTSATSIPKDSATSVAKTSATSIAPSPSALTGATPSASGATSSATTVSEAVSGVSELTGATEATSAIDSVPSTSITTEA